MDVAYVDTSCLVAIAFNEPGTAPLIRKLQAFDELIASNLLEAELLAAFARERVTPVGELLESLSWVLPDRPLHDEIRRVLGAGYVRGADCWHLATALYVAPNPAELSFMTLDAAQRKAAQTLGFRT